MADSPKVCIEKSTRCRVHDERIEQQKEMGPQKFAAPF